KVRSQAAKTWSRNSDNLKWHSLKGSRSADNRWIGLKATCPKLVAENYNGSVSWLLIISRIKTSAQLHICTEHREEVVRNDLAKQILVVLREDEVITLVGRRLSKRHSDLVPGDDIRKNVFPLLVVLVVQV